MALLYERRGLWVLSTAIILPFLMFGLGVIEAAHFFGMLIFVLYLCMLILNFEAGFLTLIFIRSSLDCLKIFTPSGGVIIGAVSIALIVLGVFYVLYSKVNILKFEDSGPYLVFLVFCGISMSYSPDLNESLSDWLRLVSIFSVYILTRIIFIDARKISRLFITIMISSILPLLVACYQLVTGHGTVFDAGQYRVMGTFLHPNPFATYLMILLIFITAHNLERAGFIRNSWMNVLAVVIFVNFVFTFSRGAWISLGVSMFFLGLIRYRRILGFMPVVLGGAFLMIPAIKDRLINIFDAGYTHGRTGWQWRLDTWSEIGEMVAQKPLFGHGLSAVGVELGILTHNDYLRLAAEIGILGLTAYLYLSFTVIRQTWKDYRVASSDVSKCFQAALLAASVGFLVREFADNTLRDTVVMMYFWIFVAMARNMAHVFLGSNEVNSRTRAAIHDTE